MRVFGRNGKYCETFNKILGLIGVNEIKEILPAKHTK